MSCFHLKNKCVFRYSQENIRKLMDQTVNSSYLGVKWDGRKPTASIIL